MLIPLNVALIYQIKEEVKRVLLYSCTRLAIASPYAISILYVLAIAKGKSYLIIKKDSSKGDIKAEVAKEPFVNKLVKAN
jgi:hypothetical protein